MDVRQQQQQQQQQLITCHRLRCGIGLDAEQRQLPTRALAQRAADQAAKQAAIRACWYTRPITVGPDSPFQLTALCTKTQQTWLPKARFGS
jgi:hypothetical protein